MNRSSAPVSPRWALVVMTAAVAMALGGCGRKGGLDLPSTSAATDANNPQTTAEREAEANRGTLFDPSFGTNRPPEAAKGNKNRPFILDPLLDH